MSETYDMANQVVDQSEDIINSTVGALDNPTIKSIITVSGNTIWNAIMEHIEFEKKDKMNQD